MTYADTITLLLCLFMVLLSLSHARRDMARTACALPVAIAKPIEPFGGRLPFPPLQAASGTVRDDADEIADDSGVAVRAQLIARGMMPSRQSASVPARSGPSGQTGAVALPATLTKLMAEGNASVQRKGDRLTSMQMSSAAFFAVGSAAISEPGKVILRDVAATLRSPRLQAYQITVEGHTDDQPISSPQFPSNWELSTARASAVVHFLLDQGVEARRLRAAGYADTFPVAPNRDADGHAIAENQARNRRVVIKLERVDSLPN